MSRPTLREEGRAPDSPTLIRSTIRQSSSSASSPTTQPDSASFGPSRTAIVVVGSPSLSCLSGAT